MTTRVRGRVQSVERCIDILTLLASGPENLTGIARSTRLSKGTAFRLLSTLSYRQLVVKQPEGSLYMLGPGCLRLVHGVVRGFGWITAIAKPELAKLWQATGETITVHVRWGSERVCVEELPSAHPIRYTASVGASTPIYVGSAGKVLLAGLPEDELEAVLSSLTLSPLTERTITDRESLRRELVRVKRLGYAESEGERVAGAAAISVPVVAPQEMLVAISILGPTSRLTSQRRREYLPLLQSAASNIAKMLIEPAASA